MKGKQLVMQSTLRGELFFYRCWLCDSNVGDCLG